MKYLLIFKIIFLITFSSVFSIPVDQQTAEIVANSKLFYDEKTESFNIYNCIEIINEQNNNTLAYAFELDPTGYIIITADNDLPPIIAYSYTDVCRIINEKDNILFDIVQRDIKFKLEHLEYIPSDVIQDIKNQWTEYISCNFNNIGDPFFEQWPPAGSTPTDGWLMENWTQGSPYNNYCPMDLIAGSRSVAGCPAVAMGMIVNFQGNTNSTRFDDNDDYYHNYHEYYWIDNDYIAHDFPSWTQLNVYLDTLDSHYLNHYPLTSSDKGALVYACGAACHQVYTASVSGTFGVNQAYNAYIRFDYNNCELLDSTSDSLYERLSQNMKDAMPAHLAILDAAPTYGHNLVIDGYNTDDFYHLNFGWGGSYNGWYLFPLTGMPYSMNYIEGIILDIGESQAAVEEEIISMEDQSLYLSCSSNLIIDNLQINFSIDQRSQVNLSVYSVTGQLVEIIADKIFNPGSYNFNWNTNNSCSGVYIIKASSPFSIKFDKVLLIK